MAATTLSLGAQAAKAPQGGKTSANRQLKASTSKFAGSNATLRNLAAKGPSAGLGSSKLSIRNIAEPISSSANPGAHAAHVAPAWQPASWREYTALQQPAWPSEEKLQESLDIIRKNPPLVFAGEARTLQEHMAKASRGEAFVLFGGDCAESFQDFSADHIRDTFRVLLQMSAVIMFGGGIPVVKIGRMAGQFAKPRSADMEEKDGVSLPSYRGDIINSPEFTEEARIPNPENLIKAYQQSAATLNLLRAFSTGGYASVNRVADWELGFMEKSEQGKAYSELAQRIDDALRFMEACGVTTSHPLMNQTEFFISHEALLLDYEEALTREDSTTGLWYDCSAHLVWCGERTRQLDGAHVEFFKGIGNPIGIKVSNKMPPQDLVELCQMVNPGNVPGRVSIIVRMGADNLRESFPALIRAVREAGLVVTWVCDPMHGNTICVNNFKTRPFEAIRAEIEAFFDVHDAEGSTPGGVHLEMTGDDVTECTGGGAAISATDLEARYHTHCDPRLNAAQSLELGFFISNRLRQHKQLMAERQKLAEAGAAVAN